MVCKEALECITDYFDDSLDLVKRQHVEEHLLTCSVCRDEFKEYEAGINDVKLLACSQRKGMMAGCAFEALMKEALMDEKTIHVKRFTVLQKVIVIAALAAICISLAVFTPVYAAIKDGIDSLIAIAMGDRGIMKSLELGLGQVIEQSVSENDVVFTVHKFISDKNRTILLYSVKYEGNLEEPADDIQLRESRGSKVFNFCKSYATFS